MRDLSKRIPVGPGKFVKDNKCLACGNSDHTARSDTILPHI